MRGGVVLPGNSPDGNETIAINVRCLDGVDLCSDPHPYPGGWKKAVVLRNRYSEELRLLAVFGTFLILFSDFSPEK